MSQCESVDLNPAFLKKIGRFIYNIALRMLWHPQDAEDAAQEILIKVITNIEKFSGKSKIETWIYRIAVNYLLDARSKRFGVNEISFEDFSQDVNIDYSAFKQDSIAAADEKSFIQELKVGCTHALLQCLDKQHRLVFILGEIFGIDSTEGSEILDIKPATFRKQLSRARSKVNSFMKANCGLMNPQAQCNCKRRIPVALERQRINKDNLLFTENESVSIQQFMDNMYELDDVAKIYRSHPYYQLDETFLDKLKTILKGSKINILSFD